MDLPNLAVALDLLGTFVFGLSGGTLAVRKGLDLVGVLALTVTALWQALRSRAHTGGEQLLWALVIVVAPVLGSIAWFVLGRAPRRSTGTAA